MMTLPPRHVAWLVIGALLLPAAAPAQHYLLLGKNRTTIGPAPPIPPTQTGAIGFLHWNLREFPDCRVPYANNTDGTTDVQLLDAVFAIGDAFATWENVTPACIAFEQNFTSTATLGMDGENVTLWDGGNATNLIMFGPAPGAALAITVTSSNARGVIQEADILFNDRDYQWNTTGMDPETHVETGNPAPFALANNDTLVFRLNGGPNITVTFTDGGNIPNIGAAIDDEVRDAINAAIGTQQGRADTLGVTALHVGITSTAPLNGNASVEIVGGTANAAGKLNFPLGIKRPRSADIETIALHEIGHFVGIAHTSEDGDERNLVLRNAVMYFEAPGAGTKRVLRPNDEQALNFLYTPDLGDAPDPADGGGPFNRYPTLVHGNGNGRTLNGIQLTTNGLGADHLFGFRGPTIPGVPSPTPPARTPSPATFEPAQDFSRDRYEWLGANVDDSPVECEARIPDMDLHDDGVTFPPRLLPGAKNRITVRVSTNDPGGRYDATNAQKRLYFNAYFDFDADRQFAPAERVLSWSGVPGTTSASSANFVPGASNLGANPMILAFDLQAPNAIPAGFSVRARLDFGEDEGRAAGLPAGGWEQDLGAAVGAAQFGEVEDYRAPAVSRHFLCYETHRPGLKLADVSLEDQFGLSTVTVKKARRLCAPANKNGEDPVAPFDPAHLTSYSIAQVSPPFKRRRGVTVTNQFGSLTVDLAAPDRLLVPTAKSLTGTPGALLEPIDHLKCYRVKGARFRRSNVTVATQFGSITADVKRPVSFCTPVDKNGEGLVDPVTHLMCYKVKASRPELPPAVFTNEQFAGDDNLALFGPRELCVPSTKTLP